MPSPEFFQTVMGRAFYEGTVPQLARSLAKLADGVHVIATELAKRGERSDPDKTLDDIALIIDGKLAHPDGWEAIADLLRAAGRKVRAP